MIGIQFHYRAFRNTEHSLPLSINFKQTYWYILFVRIPRILPSMRHSLFLPPLACRDIVQLHHHSFVPSNPSGHMCIVDSLCLNWYSSTQPYSNKKFSSIIIGIDFNIQSIEYLVRSTRNNTKQRSHFLPSIKGLQLHLPKRLSHCWCVEPWTWHSQASIK